MTDRSRAAGFRPDIQALRALAIVSVVVYHLQAGRLSGGYLGVDVFFVISGFLITSHLLRDSADGSLSLRRFWARRIRRLLPASLTVLLLTAIATAIIVPGRLWGQFFGEIGASAFYVENWYLAGSSIDYLAQNNPPSPVQHFWSLGAEEQFYLVWPVLIALTLLVLRRSGRTAQARRAIGIVLLVITVASFAWAVYYTSVAPSASFFVSTSRAWEFGAGSLLAFSPGVLGRMRLPKPVIGALAWVGWAVAIVCMMRFTSHTPHPGVLTLMPVAAAVLILAAGGTESRFSPRLITSLPPLQWIGNWSYSWYLWHWAPIALIPYITHTDLTTVQKAGIIVGSLAVAFLSYRFIEQRGLRLPLAPRGRTLPWFAGALVVGLVILGGAAGASAYQVTHAAQQRAAAEANAAAHADCLGAASIIEPGRCAGVFDGADLVPGTASAPDDQDPRIAECVGGDFDPCQYTGGDGSGPRVAVVGDSHMAHLAPLMYALADQYDWHMSLILKNACPFSTASRSTAVTADDVSSCKAWNAQIVPYLAAQKVDLVITSQFSGVPVVATEGRTINQTAIDGVKEMWSQVLAAGPHILVIRDDPYAVHGVQDCIDKNFPDFLGNCDRPQSSALKFDPSVDAAKSFDDDQVRLADMTPLYCANGECPAVIGGVDLYRDGNGHLTATYVRTEIPYAQRYLPVDWLKG